MAYIQGKSNASFGGAGGLNIAVTLDSAVSSGSLVCGYVTNSNSQTLTSVTDDQSNTYTLITTGGDDTTNSQRVTCFYKENITNAPTTLTATFSAETQYFAIFADEFSAIATTSALTGTPGMNVQNSPGTATDAVTSPSTTPGENGALIYGFTQNDSGSTLASAGTGFTNAQSNVACAGRSEYKIQTTAAATAATFTVAANESHITGVMAFKAAGGGPAFTSRNLLLGVG